MPLLPVAILTMTAAQLLDLGTFVTMIARVGPAAEANPLVAGLLAAYGIPMTAVAKVALIALVVAIAAVLSARATRADRLIAGVVVGVAILAGVIGGATNALTMGPL
jgi:hypothetical protein